MRRCFPSTIIWLMSPKHSNGSSGAQQPQTQQPAARLAQQSLCSTFEHGSHNVSRWMTWLPISLKNAAKCDKWYQLQNHSITESLNANGAREKPPTAIPVHAVSLSVEQKPNLSKESWLVWSLPRQRGRGIGRPSGYPEFNASHRRFMGNSHSLYSRVCFIISVEPCAINKRNFLSLVATNLFCYRPECGRITRRT